MNAPFATQPLFQAWVMRPKSNTCIVNHCTAEQRTVDRAVSVPVHWKPVPSMSAQRTWRSTKTSVGILRVHFCNGRPLDESSWMKSLCEDALNVIS